MLAVCRFPKIKRKKNLSQFAQLIITSQLCTQTDPTTHISLAKPPPPLSNLDIVLGLGE